MKNDIKLERSEIAATVISCVENVLSEMGESPEDPLGESTCITGDRSVLDSLGLITLLFDLEKKLEEEYGVSLTLADDRASQEKNSPLRTVRSLTEYIYQLMDEPSNHDAM